MGAISYDSAGQNVKVANGKNINSVQHYSLGGLVGTIIHFSEGAYDSTNYLTIVTPRAGELPLSYMSGAEAKELGDPYRYFGSDPNALVLFSGIKAVPLNQDTRLYLSPITGAYKGFSLIIIGTQ